MRRLLFTVLCVHLSFLAGCDSAPEAAGEANATATAPAETAAASNAGVADAAGGTAEADAASASPEADAASAVEASPDASSEAPEDASEQAGGDAESPEGTAAAGLPKLGPWPATRSCIKEPLTDAEREVFFGTASDAQPEVLDGARPELEGQHYLGSDEWNLHLFAPTLKGLGEGGAYVGIGTDQAYFFIGWMQPQVAWVIDYDPWVVNLHKAYEAFFKNAETVDDFLYLWKRSGQALEILEETYKDSPRKDAIIKSYKLGRQRIHNRFERLNTKYKEEKVSAFINDDEQYAYVRDLVRAGCTRSMLGNLLESRGLQGIGDASHALGIPVRALYLSNAEMYWDYTDQYKTNVRAMNTDEQSLILRTYASIPQNNDYRYNIMAYALYLDFLATDWVEDVKDIIRFRSIKSETDIDFFTTNDTPEERYERHKARLERRKKRRRNRKSGDDD